MINSKISSAHTSKKGMHERSRRGAVLIEGAAVMIMLAALTVGAVALIGSTALASYYKEKIFLAAQTAANYASSRAQFLGADRPNYNAKRAKSETIEVANTVLTKMGLPRASRIDVDDSVIAGRRYLTVTINEDGLSIISGGILPSAISLRETASVAFEDNSPVGVLGITIGESPNGSGFYIPVYGAGRGTNGPTSYPRGRFPYWALGIQASSSNLQIGPFQNKLSGGQFRSY
jgi:hypothetical protein